MTPGTTLLRNLPWLPTANWASPNFLAWHSRFSKRRLRLAYKLTQSSRRPLALPSDTFVPPDPSARNTLFPHSHPYPSLHHQWPKVHLLFKRHSLLISLTTALHGIFCVVGSQWISVEMNLNVLLRAKSFVSVLTFPPVVALWLCFKLFFRSFLIPSILCPSTAPLLIIFI